VPVSLSGFDQTSARYPGLLIFPFARPGTCRSANLLGPWLFPFGVLVIRSGFIPRFLGYLLFIAGVGYIANSFAALLLPAQRDLVARFADIFQMAELPIIFWLLIWGAKDQQSDKQIPDPAIA